MIDRISEISDLGFEFSFKWDKSIYIEISYTENNISNSLSYNPTIYPNSFGNSSFISSTKPILTFKMDSDDINFNFVKENLESILNEFIKTFLNWYNSHIDSMTDILKNFDDSRILRNVEEKICRYVKLENLTN